MLSNEKWDLSDNGKVLMDAANYLDEHGWCRGAAVKEDGSVCFYGAIAAVIGSLDISALRIDRASPNFSRFLSIQALIDTEYFVNGAATWNDRMAQSKEQVVAKLRELALII